MLSLKILLVISFTLPEMYHADNPYVKYMAGFKNPGSLSDVFEDSINKQYKFGLPKMFVGSRIFPLQRKIYFKENNDQLFWQTVKTWILKSDDVKDADNTYNNIFLPEALNFLCEGWSCCINTADCTIIGNNPKNGPLIIEMLGEQFFTMPFRFLVIWCEIAWKIYYRDTANNWDTGVIYDSIRRFCPNSCNTNPCSTKTGVENPNKCILTGSFVDQYQCECSSGKEWNDEELLCISLNACDQTNYIACDQVGTIKCINSGDIGFTCICKEQRMGFDCTQERNACVENFNTSELNGNHYCNVKFANKCHPYFGSNFYRCECTEQYTAELSIPFDNCLKQVDSCEFAICLNGGICTTSPDQTETACQCPKDKKTYPMFIGSFCEITVGEWSDWSQWTNCRPKCGENRYRLRKRFCLNSTTECEGFSEEIMACEDVMICPKLKLSGSKKSDLVDYAGLILMTSFVAMQLVASFFLAQFLIINREVIFPFIIKHCCAPCYKSFRKQM